MSLEIDKLNSEIRELDKIIAELDDEIKRLRKALNTIGCSSTESHIVDIAARVLNDDV